MRTMVAVCGGERGRPEDYCPYEDMRLGGGESGLEKATWVVCRGGVGDAVS